MLRAQTLQRSDHFVLRDLNRVGDHTRGLFEAEASIAVSAAHALKNIEIVFLARHAGSPQFVIPEKPTLCVVINSVAVSGAPSSEFTVTRTRTKIRQVSPRHRQ